MGTVELVAIVLAITQAIKKAFKLSGIAAMILTAVVSIGVVGYKYMAEGLPFEIISFIGLLIAVFVAANGGYGLIKRASGK